MPSGSATSSRKNVVASCSATRFKIAPNERFIVAEDVVTRGGRVQETIDIVRENGGVVAAVAVIVDRSGGNRPDFGCPFVSLIEMNVETFEAENLPSDRYKKTPAIKTGKRRVNRGANASEFAGRGQ